MLFFSLKGQIDEKSIKKLTNLTLIDFVEPRIIKIINFLSEHYSMQLKVNFTQMH